MLEIVTLVSVAGVACALGIERRSRKRAEARAVAAEALLAIANKRLADIHAAVLARRQASATTKGKDNAQ